MIIITREVFSIYYIERLVGVRTLQRSSSGYYNYKDSETYTPFETEYVFINVFATTTQT